ncbi:DNA-formamidopyrimidine glycosylase [Heyndrickxia coagulans]|uniref:DNA-formamidopyrimidine glycosylase n=1 Tax=Heyndrickxia TaxID=2837504 RepID=UPI002E2105F8|nr:DNA-formamidopyrimidine glycosylase [Heyndrickxia coagulans]MED4940715.1 DNA-formamidopyrimidine glycosylase [Heyndrickxia coagulans]
MPELPEVETIRRTLAQLVAGETIESVTVLLPKMVKKPLNTEAFVDALAGETIRSLGRRGKFLIFYTDHYALVSHLRMEGRYRVYGQNEPVEKHTHMIFHFQSGKELRYKDVRKFGTMHLFLKGEELSSLPLSKLGPEPLSDAFTEKYLYGKLKKTERNVKSCLLDQTVISGLGNIYVDEALFRARIFPERKAKSLTKKDVHLLHSEIIQTLQEAVEKGGSTVRSYVNSQGQMGMFQLELYVYGRKGEPCRKCGTPIEKMVTAGRGTHYCPNCQKKRR